MLPAPEAELRRALTALDVKTIHRTEGETDLILRLKIYLAELKSSPGDIVLDVLRRWPQKFFPAWPELRDAITTDPRLRERTLRIQALETFLRGGPEKPKGPRPTDAQHARVAAFVAECRATAPAAHPAPTSGHHGPVSIREGSE